MALVKSKIKSSRIANFFVVVIVRSICGVSGAQIYKQKINAISSSPKLPLYLKRLRNVHINTSNKINNVILWLYTFISEGPRQMVARGLAAVSTRLEFKEGTCY